MYDTVFELQLGTMPPALLSYDAKGPWRAGTRTFGSPDRGSR